MTRGTKVGSFAWNQHRHLEAYFAVPCSGAILHMVNIRLSEEHLIYIINHAEDEILMVDVDLLPIIENIAPKLKTVKHYIVMTDDTALPKTTLQNVLSYEELLATADEEFQFQRILMKKHLLVCAIQVPRQGIQKELSIHIGVSITQQHAEYV